jgi:hypothetical protein
VALYLLCAWIAGTGINQAGFTGATPVPSAQVFGVQIFFSLCSMIALYLHLFCQPFASKVDNPEMYGCLFGFLGRFVFLTRQSIALQAIHLLFTCFVPFLGQQLAAGIYTLSVFVGGWGVFVTVQFFVLVVPGEKYQKTCDMWASRGIMFKLIGQLTHIPGAFLAAADVCLLKSKKTSSTHFGLIQTTPSFLCIMCMCFGYTVFYISLIFMNNRGTGEWPYEFLYKFKWKEWVKFIIGQNCVLVVFALIVYGLTELVPAVFW